MPRLREMWDDLRKPKTKFSLDHLKYLHSVLVKNPVINSKNRTVIVETLRQIAELIIWGDQNNELFFEFFLEKNILSYIFAILHQKTSQTVKVQLLQTLSILIENIRSETSLFFLLSNNHVNRLIQYEFDFSDEELLAYYISFLKTLSLKLNVGVIQFFYNDRENTFPLYAEAVKFFNHPESMIRTAVRTLSLNVYKVPDEGAAEYVLDRERRAGSYFTSLVWFIDEQSLLLDQATDVESLEEVSMNRLMGKVNLAADELLDLFYYLQDILSLKLDQLIQCLNRYLLSNFIFPLLVGPLVEDDVPRREDGSIKGLGVRSITSLFLMGQCVHVITNSALINSIASVLLLPEAIHYDNVRRTMRRASNRFAKRRRNQHRNMRRVVSSGVMMATQPPPAPSSPKTAPKTGGKDGSAEEDEGRSSTSNDAEEGVEAGSDSGAAGEDGEESGSWVPEPTLMSDTPATSSDSESDSDSSVLESKQPSTNLYRQQLVENLTAEDDRLVLGVLILLYALTRNPSLDKGILDLVELFPYRSVMKKKLLVRSRCAGAVRNMLNSDEQDDLTSEGNHTEVELESVPGNLGFEIVNGILHCLSHAEEHRLITLQMAIMVLKELVYCNEGPPNLSEEQRQELMDAYEKMVGRVQRGLTGEMSDVFLELFEDEIRGFRQIHFESLATDPGLLLPVPTAATPGMQFSRRLPSTDVERVRAAIQHFLLLRELKYTLFHETDTQLPLKEVRHPPSLKEGATIPFEPSNCVRCLNFKRAERYLKVENKFLLILVPSVTEAGSGVIEDMLALQNVQFAINQSDTKVLLLRTGSLEFDSDEECHHARAYIESGRQTIRQGKMNQLCTLVGLNPGLLRATDFSSSSRHQRSKSNEMKPEPSLDPREVEAQRDRERVAMLEAQHRTSGEGRPRVASGRKSRKERSGSTKRDAASEAATGKGSEGGHSDAGGAETGSNAQVVPNSTSNVDATAAAAAAAAIPPAVVVAPPSTPTIDSILSVGDVQVAPEVSGQTGAFIIEDDDDDDVCEKDSEPVVSTGEQAASPEVAGAVHSEDTPPAMAEAVAAKGVAEEVVGEDFPAGEQVASEEQENDVEQLAAGNPIEETVENSEASGAPGGPGDAALDAGVVADTNEGIADAGADAEADAHAPPTGEAADRESHDIASAGPSEVSSESAVYDPDAEVAHDGDDADSESARDGVDGDGGVRVHTTADGE